MRTESFTTASKNLESLVEGLGQDKAALILRADGTPAAYLVDPATFEAAEAAMDRMHLMEALAVGVKAYEEGRIFTNAQVKEEMAEKMAKWLK